MKIIGRNSLFHWIKYPFLIHVTIFVLSTIWIFGLIIQFIISGTTSDSISKRMISYKPDDESLAEIKTELVEFKYPFTKMCMSAENSLEGIGFAVLGLSAICFILIYAYLIIKELSTEEIFKKRIVNYFRYFGTGLIIFGIIHFGFDIYTSANQIDITPPSLYILVGIILLFMKEIFSKGKIIQEENELTI